MSTFLCKYMYIFLADVAQRGAPARPGSPARERSMFSVLPAYITPETASELVQLEPVWDADPLPSAKGRSDCPHEAGGLSSWHDASTWSSGTVPVAGEDVTLAEGVSVLISSSPLSGTTYFGKVTVPASSELIFGENAAGIAFGATGMDVSGALRLGAPGCRLSSYITITLHGSRPTPDATTGIISQDAWIKGSTPRRTANRPPSPTCSRTTIRRCACACARAHACACAAARVRRLARVCPRACVDV